MRTKACYALNPHTTVSTFKALICQNALLPSEDVCDGIYGYSYILYIYRTLYIYLLLNWDGLKTQRHISLYCQFTRNMKTQQKEEKNGILLSLSLPFFFMSF